MMYRAVVLTDDEEGVVEAFVSDEGFAATLQAVCADIYPTKREAEEAGRFYARLAHEIASDMGLQASTKFLRVERVRAYR